MTDTTTTSTTTAVGVWPCFTYADARAAIRFLVEAFGFEELVAHGEGARVDHAELRWPGGGGVMLGSSRPGPDGERRALDQVAGRGATYLVTSDADALFARATAAGAEVVMGLTDTGYGSRDFSVRDPEGNLWSFGTYPGHTA